MQQEAEMKRIRSSFALGLPLVFALGIGIPSTTILTTAAYADENDWEPWQTWTESDGTVVTAFVNPNDRDFILLVEVWKDGSVATHIQDISGKSDPGPDDNGKGTEPVNVAGLIAKGRVKYQVKANPENTPLASWIDSEGGGATPHWNPGDDTDNKGPGNAPTINTGGPTEKQKQSFAKLMNEAAKQVQAFGTSMGGDVDALGNENAPGLPVNKNGNSGGKGNTNNGTDNNSGKRKTFGSDMSLGPRPDLVNPPHSKSLNTMTPGLLEGGGSLSTNGPSGTGRVTGGGSHGGIGAGAR
jgi:hypothetical protein